MCASWYVRPYFVAILFFKELIIKVLEHVATEGLNENENE
jgi:hypothetical protein